MIKFDITCPHCGYIDEDCNFPDLFYTDKNNSKEINRQLNLLQEMQDYGFNVVTCGECGNVFIARLEPVRLE